MAEALGLAASVAGLVSLGLQITGGIATYLDALESRQDELASVKRQNDSLSAALGIIKAASSRFQNRQHDHAVTTSIQSCEADLQAIEVLLADLANCDTSTWRQRLRSTKKKLSYAFDRSKVQQLAQRLHHANEVLQLTLTGLGLDISGSSIDKLTVIESTSRNHASELLLLRSEVTAAITPATDIRDQMPLLQSGIDATSSLVVSHSAITSFQIQESSRATQHSIERSHDSLQLTLGSRIERIEQILEVLQSNSQRDQPVETLARRAAGKPAMLKDLCDSVHHSRHDPNPEMPLDVPSPGSGHRASVSIGKPQLGLVTRRLCICPRLRLSSTHRRIDLGHFHLSQELENQGHWPGCPLSNVQSSRKVRRAVGLKYTGLSDTLKSVIGISFAMTSGAGGFSIGPTFTYYPTVDADSDPAFLVLNLIKRSLMRFLWRLEMIELYLPACIKKLAKLLGEKKAHPTATTSRNESLMHYAAEAFSSGISQNRGFLLELFQILLDYGVPAFTYDFLGESPLLRIVDGGNRRNQEAIEFLIQADADGKPAFVWPYRFRSFLVSRGVDTCRLYDVSRGLAEACGCGPLSMAVICNDLSGVVRTLGRFPDSLTEVNIYGQTPLHLAASKADILTRLLQVAKPHDLDQLDGWGFSALETALVLSSDRCANGKSAEICHGCACATCVDLLLEAGCALRMEKVLFENKMEPFLFEFLDSASELVRHRYISHMTQRTRQLLPSFEIAHPSNHPHIYEANLCKINAPTANCEKRSTNVDNVDDGRQLAWVYEEVYDNHLADLLYLYGIRPDPSIFIHLLPRFVLYIPGRADVRLLWLLQHGADLYHKSPIGPLDLEDNPGKGTFGAHYAFYVFGLAVVRYRSANLLQFDDIWEWMAATKPVVRDNLTDGCKCHCSTMGCDPFIWFLKGMMNYQLLNDPESYIPYVHGYYDRCGTELTVLTYKTAIRYTTFQALGLVHTCCAIDLQERYNDPKSDRDPWLEKDEVEAINEEQAPLLKLHEELVTEFQEKASEYVKEESHGGLPFHLFWIEHWVVRMKQELKSLDGSKLTAEERRGAEGIGVSWCEPPVETKREANPYHRETMEHWFFELDLVCPELNEPWPEELRRVDELP